MDGGCLITRRAQTALSVHASKRRWNDGYLPGRHQRWLYRFARSRLTLAAAAGCGHIGRTMPTPGFFNSLFLANDAATTALGSSLAPVLRAGDTLLLDGEIGAGKTHFARSLIQTRLGHPEEVPSPTYTLVQTYTADIEIWHADLYRLGDVSELEELGLLDAFESAIVLIEWPDRLGDAKPSDALRVDISQEGNGRRFDLSSNAMRWAELSESLGHV